ncbi:hypothetical protein LJR161_000605 [Variovorax paradoxus]|uniref:DUF2155 domain-containing protein n=1 Tax=Variovorax paradoxus TaxID=34073 RepID=A0AAW8ECX8_VARPD|nr:hypothetical protein [Variovorax paradoxus]MDP9969952.1 hypothetical protein [Variovorax paradoxus]
MANSFFSRLLAIAFASAIWVGHAHASCRYPLADGGEAAPTAPNVVGTVVKVESTRITLRTRAGHVKIGTPSSGVYYTAFGGDDPIEKLKEGLVARAWFVGCKAQKDRPTPKVAYLEVYSNDPNDHPPASYWERY